MAKLDFEKGPADRDPATIQRDEIAAQSGMSDLEIKTFKQRIAISAIVGTKVRTARISFNIDAAAKIKKTSTRIKFIEQGGKVDANNFIHTTELTVMREIYEGGHGDCSHARQLVSALPSQARRQQLALWFCSFSPIVVQLAKKGWKASLAGARQANPQPFDLDGAARSPFYKL